MKKTWHEIARFHDGNTPPTFELELYRKMLDIFHVGEFYYYILNIAQVEMEFVSDKVIEVLGFQQPEHFTAEYIYNNIHPEDKMRFIAHEKKVTEFFNNLPPDKVLKYKVSYDYRIRRSDGTYIWVLMQTVTIQSNEEGAVIRVLGVQTNITHLKTDNTPSGLSFIGLEGEQSYYNVDTVTILLQPSASPFSKREKQVLKLMVEGKNTLEIADQLCISKHTVNSHRKQIFSKSCCQTNIELGSKAIREGWV